jgi:hypothetical protein
LKTGSESNVANISNKCSLTDLFAYPGIADGVILSPGG